ncbi:hypothetical protein JKP75_16575 [Blastococcus sp. TML/M2B]|nr:hypothetical protein [Blastococcus sp. TML/M2B]MBN1095856.1 hypothetical protein [Blastococcus sp. TML/C7B]
MYLAAADGGQAKLAIGAPRQMESDGGSFRPSPASPGLAPWPAGPARRGGHRVIFWTPSTAPGVQCDDRCEQYRQ